MYCFSSILPSFQQFRFNTNNIIPLGVQGVECTTRVQTDIKHFLIKTYLLILITLVEDDPGTEVGLLISAKRKTFAILKHKIKYLNKH